MQEFLITIAEGSRQLGISERRLRTTLRDPDLQGQLRKTSKAVGGRERAVLMITPQLLSTLKTKFPPKQARAQMKKANEAVVGRQTGITFSGASLVGIYQRLLLEKNAVVEQQYDRICDLQRAVEYERERSKRAQLQAVSRYTDANRSKDVIISTGLAADLKHLASGATKSGAIANAPASSMPATVSANEDDVKAAVDDLSDLDIEPTARVRIYEWVLKEKDQVIQQQQQRIVDLQTSLEHERDQAARTDLILDVREQQATKLLATSNEPAPPPRKPFWVSWFKSQS